MAEIIEQPKLIFNVPSRQAPGFVKRQKRMLELMKLRKSFSNIPENPSEDQLENLGNGFIQIIDFLADYVQAETREKALELLEDASEEQFDQMFDALSGSGPKAPTVETEEKPPLKPKSVNSGKRKKVTRQ